MATTAPPPDHDDALSATLFDNLSDASITEDNHFLESEDEDESEENLEDAVAAAQDPTTEAHTVNPSAADMGVLFSDAQYVKTALLKVLTDANAPHYLYQQIMHWAREAQDLKYGFNPTCTKRSSQVRRLRKWLHMEHVFPTQRPVQLPFTDHSLPVTCFDFVPMLHSLLSDPVLVGDLAQLDVTPNDPFSRYNNGHGHLTCFNSGQWYWDAHRRLCTQPRDFLVPIIFACDETKVVNIGKLTCWPLMFTTSLLNQDLRNLPIAWRPLGYIYDSSIVESQQQKHQLHAAQKSSQLHAILKRIYWPHTLRSKGEVACRASLSHLATKPKR